MTETPPKSEYPRPDRDRSQRWLTLNGTWSLECEDGVIDITVPFAWETSASGVQRTWLERARYRRRVTVPAEWGDARVFLCFGAVHHRALVTIDGTEVGSHTGGYDSFEFDVTDRVGPGASAEIVVEVWAPADKREIAHGKQRSIPRDDYDGVSFTPTSGIWQSVWIEARGRSHISSVTVRGDDLTGFDIRGQVGGDRPATPVAVSLPGEPFVELIPDAAGAFAGRVTPREPRLWSPADPHLYELTLTVGAGEGADRVVVTSGLRRIEADGERLLLNGERLYVRGVLDQGYWPGTGLTAPSEQALLADLELARELGYNLVRKHLKFEEPRWLHAADRMGMLVWAEPACPSRFSADATAAFEAQLAPMVDRDGNHPSIIVWGLYNEEWGLDWDIPGSPERAAAASAAYDRLRALDDSRPIVENSGWAHVRSDLVDWHYYDEDPAAWADNLRALAEGVRDDFPVKLGPDFVVDKSLYGSATFPRTGVPILNSEYGAGFTSLERAWHVRWQTQELRRHDRFAGYVYTELADVEHEMAGLVDAHRRRKDWGGLDPADANAETVLVLDLVPVHAGADVPTPAAALVVPVRVSHHGTEDVTGRVHAAWVSPGAPFGDEQGAPLVSSDPLIARPFALSEATTLIVAPPGRAARLQLWLTDERGRVRARTFIDAGPIEPPNRRGARES